MRSLSFSAALQDLSSLLTRLQVAQLVPMAIDDDEPERERLLAIAVAFSPEFVQLAYQITNIGRKELSTAPDEYAGFVMTLLRLYTFRPGSVADILSSVVSRVKPIESIKNAVVLPVAILPECVDMVAESFSQVVPAKNHELNWHQIVSSLQLTGLARTLAQHCELRYLEENECLLRLAPAHAHLQMKPAPEKLQQALSEYFHRPLLLRFELAQQDADTPAETASRDRQERLDGATISIEQDIFVRDVIESFDASLVESSIKPIT